MKCSICNNDAVIGVRKIKEDIWCHKSDCSEGIRDTKYCKICFEKVVLISCFNGTVMNIDDCWTDNWKVIIPSFKISATEIISILDQYGY